MTPQTRLNLKLNLLCIRSVAFVLLVIFAFAFMTGKYTEATFFIVSHYFIRKTFNKQFHLWNEWACLGLSCLIGIIGTIMTLNMGLSIISTVPVMLIIGYVGFIAADRQELQRLDIKQFSLQVCTEEQLIIRCKEHNFNEIQIRKAIDHFCIKLSYKDMAQKYFITEKSVENERNRYRKRLMK